MESRSRTRQGPPSPRGTRRSIGFFPISGKLKALSITALLLAGLALQADLFAQPGQGKPAGAPMPLAPSADGIALASPHASAVSTPSASNAWGGARTGPQATLSDRVVDYQIEATLDPVKHTIAGQQKLRWRNRSAQAVSSVYLHLYLNAFEGEHSTFFTEKRKLDTGFRSGVDTRDGEWGYIELRSMTQNGAKAPWHFVQPDNGPATDRTVVRVDLPQAVAPGAETTLDIRFFDQLPRVIARTGYFGSFHLVGQWFPKIAVLELPGERGATAPRWNAHEFHLNSEFYADFGNYDVKLTVPKEYTVGATGELQGAPQEKNGMLTHHYVQGDVHDFAWTADKRSAQPLTGNWSGPGSPPVTIKVLYPPEYASNAAPALQAAKDSLTYFSRTLGPYPYKTLTVVIPPFNAAEAGGMEYPTFITASSYAKLQPKTIPEFGLDFVTIHEFGHGYFYGILASNEFEEPILDEGLNEYWDQRMLARAARISTPPRPCSSAWASVPPSRSSSSSAWPHRARMRPTRWARTRGTACRALAPSTAARPSPCATWKRGSAAKPWNGASRPTTNSGNSATRAWPTCAKRWPRRRVSGASWNRSSRSKSMPARISTTASVPSPAKSRRRWPAWRW
ncbi:M1 family metallopeptidase [Janthinobacterium lividum]|nr:M1 family metallopeptidase [Janthinobacterium lividum]